MKTRRGSEQLQRGKKEVRTGMSKLEVFLRSVDFSKGSDLKGRLRRTLKEQGMGSSTVRLTTDDLFLVNAAGEAFHAGSTEEPGSAADRST